MGAKGIGLAIVSDQLIPSWKSADYLTRPKLSAHTGLSVESQNRSLGLCAMGEVSFSAAREEEIFPFF